MGEELLRVGREEGREEGLSLRSMLLCKSNKMFWSQEWTSCLALSWR